MAVIAGARTLHQIQVTVRAGFLPVMRVAWCTSPIALIVAQKFLPPHAWVPFFNLVAFVIGTYINAATKKKRIAAVRKKKVRAETTTTARVGYQRVDIDSKQLHDKKDEREYYVRKD